METRYIDHRRTRQHVRRVLADLRARYRDLTRSSFSEDIDPLHQQPRRFVLSLGHHGGRH